jgi:hypothetical protein
LQTRYISVKIQTTKVIAWEDQQSNSNIKKRLMLD